MDDIWEQFHRLPKAIRNAVATPEAMATIDRLEKTHPGLDLAAFVMRVMVKDIPINDLSQRLAKEAMLSDPEAQAISQSLVDVIFNSVTDYLGSIKSPDMVKTTLRGPLKPSPTSVEPPTMRSVPAPSNLPIATDSVSTPSASIKPVSKPLSPPPAPIKIPLPSFAQPLSTSSARTTPYSIDDQAEIDQHVAHLQTLAANAGPADFDAASQDIINFHHLAFSDELLTKRALAIIKARLKDIRDADETKTILARPPKVGGLGLEPDMAEAVSRTIEERAGGMKSRGMAKKPEPLPPPPPPRVPPPTKQQPAVMPPLTRDFSQLATNPTIPDVVEQPRLARPIFRPADLPPPPPPTPAPSLVSKNTPPAPAAKPVEVKPAPVAQIVQRPRMVDRPQVADVTKPNSTLGPAEEMRSLTLTEFRRLGQGAGDSIRRLLEKFDHIREESLVMWSATVASWRQSEVYGVYLDMGRQSLDQNLPISKIIQLRAAAGQEYLSEHEFNLIADLNRRLKA